MVKQNAKARKAVATVELAVCLPVIVLLVFGAIEASSFIFLKQSLATAAYEGAREAARNDATQQDATSRAENILRARNVQGFSISFPSGDTESLNRGEDVVIEVTAPTQANSPLAGQFIANRTIRSQVVMVKE